MLIIKSVNELIQWRRHAPSRGFTPKNGAIGFIPTMGALHEGHAKLFKTSVAENETTVASIFVNRTQFNNADDFEKYPKTLEHDIQVCEECGISVLFLPEFQQIYPDNYRFKVTESPFSNILCGKFRPGHFDGVLTVVLKLFQIVSPDNAYFGEKDYQQFLLISEMTKAFFLKTNVIPVETVRESSGLAKSSRNVRLSETNKILASQIYKHLMSSEGLEKIKDELTALHIEVEYLEEHFGRRFIAAIIGGVRLIDNVKIGESGA